MINQREGQRVVVNQERVGGGSSMGGERSGANRIEEMKDRFRRINLNYSQTHRLIHQNITTCLQDYHQNNPNHNHPTQQFSISQSDLTFSQAHQTSSPQYSFHQHQQTTTKNTHQLQLINNIVGSQKGSRFSSLTNGEGSGNSSRLESLNQTLGQIRGQGGEKFEGNSKYRSLTKELQGMKHKELMQLLIQEIEDNQKNKHRVQEDKELWEGQRSKWQEERDKLKANIRVRDEELAKLKLQLQNKRQQIEVLLMSQKKNLQTIDKLKKTISALSQTNPTASLPPLPHSPKPQTQSHHPTSSKPHSINPNPNPKPQTQLQQQLCTLRLQHTQLQTYMNEYIEQVTQTQEQYTRNYTQLRQSHTRIKQQNLLLTTQLQRLHTTLTSLQTQTSQLKQQNQHLIHALSNSKTFIKQLQQQFITAKDQNLALSKQAEQEVISMRKVISIKEVQVNELRLELHQLRSEISVVNEEKYVMGLEVGRLGEEVGWGNGEMGKLRLQNQRLKEENNQLAGDLEQLQEKILGNTQVQSQVKAMIQLMARQKQSIQQKVTNKLQLITKLQQQLQHKQHQILSHQTQQSTLTTNLSQLQHTITPLQQQLLLTQQQNQILQQTNTELTQLQSQLMVQYQIEKQQTSYLRQELVGIMGEVKRMEEVYGWEVGVNEGIRRELRRFWQGGLGSVGKNRLDGGCNRKQQIASISSQQQSCEISFSNKTSQITKQGSSSLFKPHVSSRAIDDANPNSSKVSQKQKICVDSIIDGSVIQEKYYSESQTQSNQLELNVLRPSTIMNVNVQQTKKDEVKGRVIRRGLNQSR